jgi:hypothetical protein
LWVLAGVVLVVVAGIGGYLAFVPRAANKVQEQSKCAVDVTYRVEGSGTSVAITYTVGKAADPAKDSAARLPWSKDVSTCGAVFLTATTDQSGGTITCRILVNGEQLSELTVTGPRARASCVADVGQLPAR